MDAFSSAAASRPLWSKAPRQKRANTHLHRKEPAVTLPVLSRRPSGQQSSMPGVGARSTSLHAFLVAQLENNERENYSRSQLRAMTSAKLLSSSNNNNSASRIHSSAERLAPLDPASFEKTRTQRRPLPGPLQAAINEVLAGKDSSEVLSERGESRDDSTDSESDEPETPVVPTCKRSSPCKNQIQSRRPEWRRYIRRIMMTKGIRGSTLARYRRLVGIVARRNLTHSYAGAAERVVRYRLEFRSAAVIQIMALRFLARRRQAKQLQRHQAAIKIQRVCRRILAVERLRKLAEVARLEEIERFTRSSAARTVQRYYRKHRQNCRLREEEQRQLERASVLQKARFKLLRRYQSWRKSSKRGADPESESGASVSEDNTQTSEPCCHETSASYPNTARDHVEAIGTCTPFVRNDLDPTETPRTTMGLPEDDVGNMAKDAAPTCLMLSENNAKLEGELSSCVDSDCILPQQDRPTDKLEDLAVVAPVDEKQTSTARNDPPPEFSAQDNQITALESSALPNEVDEKSMEDDAPSFNVEPEEDDEQYDNNASVGDVEPPAILSGLGDIQQRLDISAYVGEEEPTPDLQEATAATTLSRAATAKRIAYFLLPKLQARHALKTQAAIQIQCLVRLCLAKQCLARVRFEALQSLRAQLLASWNPAVQINQSKRVNERGIHDVASEQNDEDDELGLETHGTPGFLNTVSENYFHLLPTRNGQIPPGVPLPQSSAGAPLLALWKWSWPGERWLTTGQ